MITSQSKKIILPSCYHQWSCWVFTFEGINSKFNKTFLLYLLKKILNSWTAGLLFCPHLKIIKTLNKCVLSIPVLRPVLHWFWHMSCVGKFYDNWSFFIARKLLANIISADWCFQMPWGTSIGTRALFFLSSYLQSISIFSYR